MCCHALARRRGGSGDVAMHPIHRIGRRERQGAGQHLIQRDTKCIEIAAGVDRAIHATGLLRRHVGERAGDEIGRLGRLAFAGQPRCDAKSGQPGSAVGGIHDRVGWLDILVDQAALMESAQRGCQSNGDAKEQPDRHWRTDQVIERLTTGSFDDQHGAAGLAHELQRPQRPRTVEVVPQLEFMHQAIDAARRRRIRSGLHRDVRVRRAIAVAAHCSAEHALAVLPQDFQDLILRDSGDARRCTQYLAPADLSPRGHGMSATGQHKLTA